MPIMLETTQIGGLGDRSQFESTTLILNAIKSVKEDDVNYITNYAVVKGAANTDYIRPVPSVISVETIIAPQNFVSRNLFPDPFNLANNVKLIKSHLETVKDLAVPLRFTWEFGVINSCAIKGLSFNYENSSANSLIAEIDIQEIIVAGADTGNNSRSGQHDPNRKF